MPPRTPYQGIDGSEVQGSLWRRYGIPTGLPLARGNPYANRGVIPPGAQNIHQGPAGVFNNNIALVNGAPGHQCQHNPGHCQHNRHPHPHDHDHPAAGPGPISLPFELGQPGPSTPSGMFSSDVGQLVPGRRHNHHNHHNHHHHHHRNFPPAIDSSSFPPFDSRDLQYLSSTPIRQGPRRPRGRSPARNPGPYGGELGAWNSDNDDAIQDVPRPWMNNPERRIERRAGRGRRRWPRSMSRASGLSTDDWHDLDLYARQRRGSPDGHHNGRSSSYVRERPDDVNFNWWWAKLNGFDVCSN